MALLLVLSALVHNLMSDPSPSYKWSKVFEKGTGCTENCGMGTWPMYRIPVEAFGKLWMAGRNTVSSSSDGVRWSTDIPKTDTGERYGSTITFFDNKLWIIGGMRTWDEFRNDVWYSTNGIEWTLATAHAPWKARRGHSTVVYDGRMWIMGGAESSGKRNQLPSKRLNDVWASADGITWTLVTEHALWEPRESHVSGVLKGRMWVVGGFEQNDVWVSANGRDWERKTGNAQWEPRRAYGGIVFDNKLWMYGGMGYNDVWSSIDGTQWELVTREAPWTKRVPGHSVVFQNKLWIYGGKTGRAEDRGDDVWVLTLH